MAGNPPIRLAGVVAMTINGNTYDVVSDAVYRPTMPKRETVKGQSRVEGYSEMPQEGVIGATIRDNPAFTVQSLGLLTNAVVQLTLANGKNVVGAGMWCVNPEEVKTQEATFPIRFEGPDVSEIL